MRIKLGSIVENGKFEGLREAGTYGPSDSDILIGPTEMATNNFLFYGDNLEVLRKHIKDETVDLCYIDPPFNSKRNYNQIYNNIGSEDAAQAQAFTDTWIWDDIAIAGYDEIIDNAHGRFMPRTVELIKGLRNVLGEGSLLAYVISVTLRVTEIRRVLKETGSFYFHCDPTASHYIKLVLDTVFCSQGGDYKNEITWKRTTAHSDSKQGGKAYGNVTDIILFYTRSGNYTFNPLHADYSEKYLKKYNLADPDGRRYMLDNLTGPGGAAKGNPMYEVMGVSKFWRYSKEKMQQLIEEGRVVQPSPGAVPRYKRYLDEMPGVPMQNIWDDIFPINSQAKERLGYPTQKPLELLQRIIEISSNVGDVILDAYCGCGTTIDAARKMKRKWIGIDITYQSIAIILKRLEDTYGKKILDSIVLNGIPKDMKSAKALAHKKDDRLRKEFEKWAVLTYTKNRAVINDKKGADGGIDGRAYFKVGKKDNAKIIFQVKSGGVGRGDVAKLRGDMEKDGAALAMLITLEHPTKPMKDDAKAAGRYDHAEMGKSYDRLSIVTIEEILDGERLEIPMSMEVLKSAQKAVLEEQLSLL
jgi:site-specific DNA-methyltransferase (adenine-specific)